nr:methyltransferase domain-containing protein [Roseospira navarrensis]
MAIRQGVTDRLTALAPDRAVSVVDLGCGGGEVLGRLAEAGFRDLTGLGWRVSVPAGAARIEEVDLSRAGWAQEMVGRRFDVVVSTEVLEHLVNPYQFLVEARQLLDPDGWLVLTFPNVHNWRSIVGYALAGRFTGFFGPNWAEGHPLHDQHIFIPNHHLVRYFLGLTGFDRVTFSYLYGRSRLSGRTTMVTCRAARQ